MNEHFKIFLKRFKTKSFVGFKSFKNSRCTWKDKLKRYWFLFGLKLISLLVSSNISFKKCCSAYFKEQHAKKEIKSTISIEHDPIAQCCQISEQHKQRNVYQREKGNRDNTTAQCTYLNHLGFLAPVKRGRKKF